MKPAIFAGRKLYNYFCFNHVNCFKQFCSFKVFQLMFGPILIYIVKMLCARMLYALFSIKRIDVSISS